MERLFDSLLGAANSYNSSCGRIEQKHTIQHGKLIFKTIFV